MTTVSLSAEPSTTAEEKVFTVAGPEVGAAINKFIDRVTRSQ
jgi:hypothetical protein